MNRISDYEEVFTQVKKELVKALNKHGEDEWDNMTMTDIAAVVSEEAGEAIRAANDLRWNNNPAMVLTLRQAMITELAQTAAVAVRAIKFIQAARW